MTMEGFKRSRLHGLLWGPLWGPPSAGEGH